MAFMPAPKFWLLLGLLSGMASAQAAPFAPGQVYRFGQWRLLRAPASAAPAELAPGLYKLVPGAQPEELFLYFGDGEERALALQFSAEGRDDRAVMRSGWLSERLNGCRYGLPARLPALLSVLKLKKLPAGELPELPDDSVLRMGNDGERGVRRVGDELVADLGRFRLRILADGGTVHVGEPDSGAFCRYEVGGKEE
jgi:hypothetical protein